MSEDGASNEPERIARAELLRATEPGQRAVLQAVAEIGPNGLVERIRAGAPIGGCDVAGMQARLTPGVGERDLTAAAQAGARLVIPGDAEWPRRLGDLTRIGLGSLGLYVRGQARLDELVERSVAMVGTRAATDYGRHVARELGVGLAACGWAVVSGLAYGIDAAAHGGALTAGPSGAGTVAVLACGIDVAYPARHDGLLRDVVAAGAAVSEHPPGSSPHRARFLIRNRLIAALSLGTVVVEAAARSGARSTAKHAGALGRAVMAVPGPVTSVTSAGCHQMLRDDPLVGLVGGVHDIIEMVGCIGDLAPRAQGGWRPRDALTPLQGRVLDAVPVLRAAPVERIAATAGVSVPRVQGLLEELVRGHFVERAEAGWRLSGSERDARRALAGQTGFDLDWL